MKPEEIKLSEWGRIFLGPVPPEFYLELAIRGLLIYILLMVAMRLLGKRMSSHVSSIELAALVAFASAIGVPLLSPSNGILPAVIIAFIIVAITRGVSILTLKNHNFERASQGKLDTLVQDGVMDLKAMKSVRITRERLFSQLRSESFKHLGMVKRVYMEPNGAFTLLPNEKPNPGLLVIPEWDKEFLDYSVKPTDVSICKQCGEKNQLLKTMAAQPA